MSKCESRNGDIHFCKFDDGHKGQHYCSDLCDTWGELHPDIPANYEITVSVRTPDGQIYYKRDHVTRSEVVPLHVRFLGAEFASYLDSFSTI